MLQIVFSNAQPFTQIAENLGCIICFGLYSFLNMLISSCKIQQRVKAASSAEHMKVLAMESSNSDSQFQQLDKLRMIYEEYVKIGKEMIPLAEKILHELTEEQDQKSQALDDVSIHSGIFFFWIT